jgi:hypothetical protein
VRELHRDRPSPTALATRFTDWWRTSPAQKIPGTLGLEQVRVAGQRPPADARRLGHRRRRDDGRIGRLARDVGAGVDEAVLVPRDHAGQPVGARRGADEHEQRGRLAHLLRAVGAAQPDGLEVPVAVHRGHLRARLHAMFGVAAIWSIRYCDIVSVSPAPRTRMVTCVRNARSTSPPARPSCRRPPRTRPRRGS